MMTSYQFPADFVWGVSTAAYQIEGAIAAGGRLPSVWDTFSATPGRTLNGDTGAIACDHYHRYESDVQLLAALGVKHYRFSIAWPRIIPTGRGPVNEVGVDFYQRLVDCLLDHGITPHATLFHWDSPQALEAAYGSWRSRQMALDYGDYVSAVVRRLGDRIRHWMTINEIPCFTHMGYAVDQEPLHAPGTRVLTRKEIWQTSHHAILAHGLGCQAIRAASPGPCSILLVDNPVVTVPVSESPADIAAAQTAFPLQGANGGITFPVLTGGYNPALWEELGADAPEVQAGDLEIIHQPLDGYGLNIYTGTYVRAADTDRGYEVLAYPAGYPRLHMPWLWLVPEALYWAVRHLGAMPGQGNLPLYFTENGCAVPDQVTEMGEVLDTDRILYLRQYLKSAHRAVSEGYPVRGYFAWSLMDNFEWSWGYDRRFGLTYIDYATQKRIPKASYHWYAECIRQNRVV